MKASRAGFISRIGYDDGMEGSVSDMATRILSSFEGRLMKIVRKLRSSYFGWSLPPFLCFFRWVVLV